MRLFFTGFLQVFLVVINTWLITQKSFLGVFFVGFGISYIWSGNVKKVAFGGQKDRIIYSLGAATGGVTGLTLGVILI